MFTIITDSFWQRRGSVAALVCIKFCLDKDGKERNIQYVVFRSSYSHFLTSDAISKGEEGRRPLRDLPIRVVQTTALTLCGWTVACLTELLSRRSNIHNWPNNRGEGMSEELAAESADGHRPWLLSECEMPKPDCSPEPGGQRRSRLLSPTQRASKTIWHEDFIQDLPPSHFPPTPLQKSPKPSSWLLLLIVSTSKRGCTVKQKHVLH